MVTTGELKQYVGLSTDTKPTDKFVSANALFLELDSGDVYFYDTEDGWVKMGDGGSTPKQVML